MEPDILQIYVDCFAIQHAEDIEAMYEEWDCTFKGDPYVVEALQLLVGRFWKVAEDFNGHNVFRKEEVPCEDGVPPIPIFIWFSEQMQAWVYTKNSMSDDTDSTMAWSPVDLSNRFYPREIMLPFHEMQACHLLSIMPQHMFAEEQATADEKKKADRSKMPKTARSCWMEKAVALMVAVESSDLRQAKKLICEFSKNPAIVEAKKRQYRKGW